MTKDYAGAGDTFFLQMCAEALISVGCWHHRFSHNAINFGVFGKHLASCMVNAFGIENIMVDVIVFAKQFRLNIFFPI